MQPKPYRPKDVPPREDGGSRFHLPTSSSGFAMQPGDNVGTIYTNLVAAREQEARAAEPPTVRIVLYAAVATSDGYELRRRGEVVKPRVYEAERPTRAAKLTSTAGELLDSLLLGEGEGWETANDAAIWRALFQVAEFHGITGRALRQINEAVARCLIIRAGGEAVGPDALPQEHLVAPRTELPREEVAA